MAAEPGSTTPGVMEPVPPRARNVAATTRRNSDCGDR